MINMGRRQTIRFLNRSVCWLTLWAFLCWTASPAQAVTGKIYNDMTVSNQNTDTITSLVNYDPSGIDDYGALVIKDNTNYSPNQIFTNTGNISISNFADPSVNLIYLIQNSNSRVEIVNQGDITFTLGANSFSYWSVGINTTGPLTNSGDISITHNMQGAPTLAIARGIISSGSSLVNSGDINVLARSNDTTSGSTLSIATGVTFTGSTMTNSGDITVTARSADITGSSSSAYATATGVSTEGNFHHTGTITVEAFGGKYRANSSTPYTNGDATAYGITATDDLVLNAEGLIWATGTLNSGSGGTRKAYQVNVSSGTTTITGYSMRLSNQSQFNSTYDGAITVASGSSLVFNNAVLYLCTCNNFSGEVEYEIPMLVEGAAMADQFASIGPMPAEYQVELVNGNGTGLQKLKFTYAPEDDTALMSTEVMNAFDAREHSMIRTNVSRGIVRGMVPTQNVELNLLDSPEMLMNAPGLGSNPLSELSVDYNHQVFAGPVILAAYDDSDNGYDAHTRGMLGGYTYRFSDTFYLGGHAGVTDVDIQFTGSGSEQRSEDTMSYSLGSHAVWLLDDQWLFTALASLFYGDTDYRDEALHNLESASYESFTVLADLTVGKFMDVGWATLLPEVGLATTWNYREAFTTDNQVNADVRHGSMEEVEVYGKLGVEGYARFEMEDGVEIMPNLGVGITRTLTDGASETDMGVAQVIRTVAHHADRTTLDLGFSLTLEQENISLLVGANSAFSRNSENYLFWLELGVAF